RSSDRSWRLALLPLLVALPLAVFCFRVGPVALASATAPVADKPVEQVLLGLTLGQVAKSFRFWLLTAALLLSVTAMVGMLTNMVPLMRDNGLPADIAAKVFGAYGMSLLLGRVVVGYLIDRLWAPGVALLVLVLPAVGCLLFASMETHIPTLVLASILVGLGAGAEMDIASYLMARYFGLRDYSRIFSLHIGVISFGGALAPLFFAVLFDKAGSYKAMLFYCAVSFTLS